MSFAKFAQRTAPLPHTHAKKFDMAKDLKPGDKIWWEYNDGHTRNDGVFTRYGTIPGQIWGHWRGGRNEAHINLNGLSYRVGRYA